MAMTDVLETEWHIVCLGEVVLHHLETTYQ
jgi:hypothetical protein